MCGRGGAMWFDFWLQLWQQLIRTANVVQASSHQLSQQLFTVMDAIGVE